jgi:serine/threonine protein kinase
MVTQVLIDTSVLLDDPDVMVRVIGNKGLPFITNTILLELDFNKKGEEPINRNARRMFRAFANDSAINMSQMPDGKPMRQGDSLRQLTFNGSPVYVLVRGTHTSRSNNDSKIIEVAKDYGMIIITRDNGLKVRAETEGVEAHVWTGQKTNAKPSRTTPQRSSGTTAPAPQPFTTSASPLAERDSVLSVSDLPREGGAVLTRKSGRINLLKALNSGGEGTIYETDRPGIVCKIYRKHRLTALRQKKIELMLTRDIGEIGICWPVDLALNTDSEFVGYVMPRAHGKPIQSTMFVKPVLEKTFPNWTRMDLVNVCIAFLTQIAYLHRLNILIGDINPMNFLVDADSTHLWLVDTDSFQIEGFPCPVGTVNFTAPEIQGKSYSEFLRTKEHELFAVATMLFMILLPGKPPYAQQGGGNPAENIRAMEFSYSYGSHSNKNAPEGPWRNIWDNLPAKVMKGFFETFKNNQRIAISEWQELLEKYLHAIGKGWVSNDLFPTTAKIRDPIEVVCGSCGAAVTASEKLVAEAALRGWSYSCGECKGKRRLQILAKKSKEANQKVLQGASSSSAHAPSPSFWQTGSHTATQRSSSLQQTARRTATQRSSPQTPYSGNTKSGGGFFNWILRILK